MTQIFKHNTISIRATDFFKHKGYLTMKKLVLSVLLFLSLVGSAFAECNKSDFVGKWWMQEGKSVYAAFINTKGYALAEASGPTLGKRGDIENGSVKIYAKACRITLIRPKNGDNDDKRGRDDDDKKTIEQGGVLARSMDATGNVTGTTIIMKGATMFRRND